MKCKDLYYIIGNPITENELYKIYIKTFEIGRLDHDIDEFNETKDSHTFDEQEYNKLHTRMFNKWKRTLIARTRAEWMDLINKGVVKQDIFTLVECLKKIPDAKTYEEILNSMRYISEEGMGDLLQKYGDGCHVFASANTGTHINSYYVTACRDNYPKVEHRFYFNVPEPYQYNFINVLIDECEVHNLPYDIKIFEDERRADNVILYCDTKNLLEYIQILKQLEAKYPKLIGELLTPSILTGKINNWIGYAVEPKSGLSYSYTREFVLGGATINLYREWLKENSEKNFIYKGQKISFGEYLAREVGLVLNTKSEETKVNLDEIIKSGFNKERNFDFITSDMIIVAFNKWIQNSINNKLGAAKFKLEAPQLSDYEENILSENINKLINYYFIKIAENNPILQAKFFTILKKLCEKFEIDQEHFCFNNDSLNLLIAEDNRKNQTSQTPQRLLKNEQTNYGLSPKYKEDKSDSFWGMQRNARLEAAAERLERQREQRHSDFVQGRNKRKSDASSRIMERKKKVQEAAERLELQREQRHSDFVQRRNERKGGASSQIMEHRKQVQEAAKYSYHPTSNGATNPTYYTENKGRRR